jgi:predicted small lipoprotein YifL
MGIFDVNRNDRRRYQRWALVLMGAAALAGCGRKGPLDSPTASSQAPVPAAVQSDHAAFEQASQPNLFSTSNGSDAAPTTGKGPKRSFVLDPLLNSN